VYASAPVLSVGSSIARNQLPALVAEAVGENLEGGCPKLYEDPKAFAMGEVFGLEEDPRNDRCGDQKKATDKANKADRAEQGGARVDKVGNVKLLEFTLRATNRFAATKV